MGEDVQSPLVDQHLHECDEDIPSTPIIAPRIPEMDLGRPSLEVEDDELAFPHPPPKHPDRNSVSSFDDLPPIPKKSDARASPVLGRGTPWNDDERVRRVEPLRAVWTDHHEGSRESVGEVRDSAGHWSDDE